LARYINFVPGVTTLRNRWEGCAKGLVYILERLLRCFSTPWLWLLPTGLGILLFNLLPMGVSFLLSFTRWNLLSLPQWVGGANYQRLWTDADQGFGRIVLTTLNFAGLSLGLELLLGLLLALALKPALKGTGSLKLLFFLPFMLPMVSMSLVWEFIYDPANGLLAQWHRALGWPVVAWLHQPETALVAVVVLRVWKQVGYTMLLLLAGLYGVPEELSQAASLDGASAWQCFWRITLPMLMPLLFFTGITVMVSAFQLFDAIYLLTQGGPEQSTMVMTYSVFKQAFEQYQVGPASAMAYCLFLLLAVIAWVQFSLKRRWSV
jgi:multiple sugar transport system permease protein